MRVVRPLAAGPLWHQVIIAGGGRCCCTGQCGRGHTTTGHQCPAGTPLLRPARLYAAPLDPSIPLDQAWKLPAEELAAWCGPCLDGARREHRPATRADATRHLFPLLDPTAVAEPADSVAPPAPADSVALSHPSDPAGPSDPAAPTGRSR